MHINEIDHALVNIDRPNLGLLTFVTAIAKCLVPQNVFNSRIESDLALLAASVIFSKMFGKFDPLNFDGISISHIFRKLWEIVKNNDKNLFPQGILIFIGDYAIAPEDTDEAWRLLVQELSRIGDNDFSKLLEIDLNHDE